jgi:hypothetical protein
MSFMQSTSNQEPIMNPISISVLAIVITAMLALVTPVTHFIQHEEAATATHATGTPSVR